MKLPFRRHKEQIPSVTLPGVRAKLELTEHATEFDTKFGLIHNFNANTWTVIVSASPDGDSLVDADVTDHRVATWGAWIAGLSEESGIKQAAITVETLPDSGQKLHHNVNSLTANDAPDIAKEMLREVCETFPVGSATTRAFIALTFSGASLNTARKSREEMAADLSTRLPELVDSLTGTGAGGAKLARASEVAALVRASYDPAAAQDVELSAVEKGAAPVEWADVSPVATDAQWDYLSHDSGRSVTWGMSVAPRQLVQAQVLQRLLSPHPHINRKRVTLILDPLDVVKSVETVDSDLRSAEFNVNSAARTSHRATKLLEQAAATAAEEASGATVVMFTLLATTTVLDSAHLPRAEATMSTLAASAKIRMRKLYAAQDSGFAASLPIGFIPHRMGRRM